MVLDRTPGYSVLGWFVRFDSWSVYRPLPTRTGQQPERPVLVFDSEFAREGFQQRCDLFESLIGHAKGGKVWGVINLYQAENTTTTTSMAGSTGFGDFLPSEWSEVSDSTIDLPGFCSQSLVFVCIALQSGLFRSRDAYLPK